MGKNEEWREERHARNSEDFCQKLVLLKILFSHNIKCKMLQWHVIIMSEDFLRMLNPLLLRKKKKEREREREGTRLRLTVFMPAPVKEFLFFSHELRNINPFWFG